MKSFGKALMIQCPFCNKEELTGQYIHNVNLVNCFTCGKKYNLLDFATKLEKDFPKDEEDQLQYLKKLLNLTTVITAKDEKEILTVLEYYEKNGFDLVPIQKFDLKKLNDSVDKFANYYDGKHPIEQDWQKKNHKGKEEWLRWIEGNFNLGMKTGLVSNKTVLDIDALTKKEKIEIRSGTATKERIAELLKLREERLILVYNKIGKIMGEPLIQSTLGGQHLFYQYENELPKTHFNIESTVVDLENDGGYVLIYPSKLANNEERKFKELKPIPKMPQELKEFILSQVTIPKKTYSEDVKEAIDTENFKINPDELKLINNNLEGVCNNSFIKLGGILRKQLNMSQTEFVLNALDTHLLADPMGRRVISAMVKELEKYSSFDEEELASKVLAYLRDQEEATSFDIQKWGNETKATVDKVLSYLTKEGHVLKKGRIYYVKSKIEWSSSLMDVGVPINFKMPYFDDIGKFNVGDMILIGAAQKTGKTHLAINIVKRLTQQGITPYYIGLESGSRYARIALELGLKEGDFKHPKHIIADPTKIELEKNSVNIVDWLLVMDKSKTDLIFQRLTEEQDKKNAVLIVFQQLKEILPDPKNPDTKKNKYYWFAPNLCLQFPALSARYLYENEDDGTVGYFVIDNVRDPKYFKKKRMTIPCVYNWETKELNRKDELETAEEKPQEPTENKPNEETPTEQK
jgi:hypothetical protein